MLRFFAQLSLVTTHLVAQQSSLLVNGDFENGLSGWSWTTQNSEVATEPAPTAGVQTRNAALRFPGSGTATLWQDVVVAEDTPTRLYGVVGSNTSAPGGVTLEITTSSGTSSVGRTLLSQALGGWRFSHSITLGPGTNTIEFVTDSTGPANVWFDELQLVEFAGPSLAPYGTVADTRVRFFPQTSSVTAVPYALVLSDGLGPAPIALQGVGGLLYLAPGSLVVATTGFLQLGVSTVPELPALWALRNVWFYAQAVEVSSSSASLSNWVRVAWR